MRNVNKRVTTHERTNNVALKKQVEKIVALFIQNFRTLCNLLSPRDLIKDQHKWLKKCPKYIKLNYLFLMSGYKITKTATTKHVFPQETRCRKK